jgi:hypothetical protein
VTSARILGSIMKKPKLCIVGREDEFLFRPNMEYVGDPLGAVMDFLSAEWKQDRRMMVTEKLNDPLWLRTGGKFYGDRAYIESATVPVEFGPGVSDRLTEATLAQRILLADFMARAKGNPKYLGGFLGRLKGDNSHENIRLGDEMEKESFQNSFLYVARRTVNPLLICLFKHKFSRYGLKYDFKGAGSRLQVRTEYIPDPEQLTAANALLVHAVKYIEKVVLMGQEKDAGKFPFALADVKEIPFDTFPFKPHDDDMRRRGLESRVRIEKGGEPTVRELLKEWLDFFRSEMAPMIGGNNFEALYSYATGSQNPSIGRRGGVQHYFDIGQGYLDYLKEKTGKDPRQFVYDFIGNHSPMQRAFSEVTRPESRYYKGVSVQLVSVDWLEHGYRLFLEGKGRTFLDVPIEKLEAFNDVLGNGLVPERLPWYSTLLRRYAFSRIFMQRKLPVTEGLRSKVEAEEALLKLKEFGN